MTKKTKLKLCDWTLLGLTIAILVSGIQLEINPQGEPVWVWVHIALGILFLCGIFWHLALHHVRGMKLIRDVNTKRRHPFMGVFFVLVFISGIAATCRWIDLPVHSITGGIHGKLGFVFIITIIVHIAKNRRFYFPRKDLEVKG